MLAIDADNTIRHSKSGLQFINDPHDQEPINGAIEFLKAVKKQGHSIYIVTNQGGIEAGHKTLDNAIIEQRITLEFFPMVTAVLMADTYESSFFWIVDRKGQRKIRGPVGVKARKPNPGMLLYLESLLNNDKKNYWMVGDSADDEGAADAASWNFLNITEALKIGKIPD